MNNVAFKIYALFLIEICVCLTVSALPGKDIPHAPVPAQITTAKKVFIGNAGTDPRFRALGTRRPYDQFYAALKDLGRYELVSSPSDADLVFEISLVGQFDQFGKSHEAVANLQLQIIDPRAHVVLWTITEPLDTGVSLVGLRESQ